MMVVLNFSSRGVNSKYMMDIILAADMHLKPGRDIEQNKILSSFLDECSDYDKLILVGDTFNCWFEKNGIYVGDYSEIISIFSNAINKGLEINFVFGNRDFVFSKGFVPPDGSSYSGFSCIESDKYSVLADAGMQLRGWGYQFENDGVIYHCSHGDMYCIGDTLHQLLRYLIMGNPARLLSTFMPRFVVHAIFTAFNVYKKDARRNTELICDYLLMQDEALIPLIDSGVDHVICGHLHQYMTKDVIGSTHSGKLTVLPCWVGGEYGVLQDNTIAIKNISYS